MTALMWMLTSSWALTTHAERSLSVLDDADGAVRGVVVSADHERSGAGLVTVYTVEVEEVLRGEAPEYVEVRVPGGTDGTVVQRVAGVATWEEGQDVVVLLDARGEAQLTGLFQVRGSRIVDPLGPGTRDLPTTLSELEEVIRYPALAPDRDQARTCVRDQARELHAEGWSLRAEWTVTLTAGEQRVAPAQTYAGGEYRLLVCGADGVGQLASGVLDGDLSHQGAADRPMSIEWTSGTSGTELLVVQLDALERGAERGAVGVALLWR